jgi:uncharacterized protein YoxC
MPLLLTVCLVAATTAQVALAIVAIRALTRFNRVTDELERGARDFSDLASQTKALARELQGLVASLRGVVSPVRATAEAFGRAAERAANLGSAVLQEMEGSVRTTSGLLRGVQVGAGYFLNRLVHSGQRARNGGNSHERTSAEQ